MSPRRARSARAPVSISEEYLQAAKPGTVYIDASLFPRARLFRVGGLNANFRRSERLAVRREGGKGNDGREMYFYPSDANREFSAR